MATANTPDGVTWPQEDFARLLAYLDFIVEGREARSFTDREAQLRQQEVLHELSAKLTHKYTVTQIQERFWQDFCQGYMYPEDNFPRLFILGSSEICTLDDQTRQLVRHNLESIRLEGPRERRPKAVSTSQPTADHKRSSKVAKSRRKTRTSKPSSRLPRCPSPINEIGNGEAETEVGSVLHRHIGVRDAIVPRTEDHSKPQQPYSSGIVLDSFASIQSCETKLTTTSNLSKHTTCDHERTTTPPSRGTTPGRCKNTFSDTTYEDMLHDIAYYRSLYEDAEAECKHLAREKRQLISSFKETKGFSQKMQQELEKKNRKIATQKAQLTAQDWLQPYLALGNRQGPAPNAGALHSSFEEMQSQFTSLLVIRGFRALPPAAIWESSSDTRDLLNGILGVAQEKTLEAIPDVPVGAMIQALTGAAVCQWVFRNEFYCDAMANTPLLQKYCHIISSICGEDGLANVDSAAHQLLIEEAHFNDVVLPRLASRLTERLLNVLHVFIDDLSRSRATAKLRQCLSEVFIRALKVRSLVLTGPEYEDTWPSISDRFDGRTMETDPVGVGNMKCQVKLPLIPGLRARAGSNQVVGCRGSGGFDVKFKSEAVVVKAIVLV